MDNVVNQKFDENCSKCSLSKFRSKIVWAQNPSYSSWNGLVLVGEAPGVDEDRTGEPFTGRAGSLLQDCLHQAKLIKKHTYITNVLKCRPPSNKIGSLPALEGLSKCPDLHLFKELKEIGLRCKEDRKSWIVLALGATATKELYGEYSVSTTGIIRNIRLVGLDDLDFVFMSVIHPAYVLRNPVEKDRLISSIKKASGYLYA